MLHHFLRASNWAVALTASTALTLSDPPAAAERALLGKVPARETGSSNLWMARLEGQVSAGRALLGKLAAASEEQAAAEEAIQIRPRRADGQGALLGRP